MNTIPAKDIRILIVEDDHGLAELLRDEVEDAGMSVRLAHTAEDGLAAATSWMPDIIVSDLRLPGADGLALLGKVRTEIPENTPGVLIITAFGTVPKAVQSLKAGAEDFLTKPLDLEHFKLSLDRILEKRKMREQLGRIKSRMEADSTFHGMYGRCQPMASLFRQIRQVAKAEGPVLILGESGTGKELVARAVHKESGYAAGLFLAVNCAGIPEHLLESEFFGHESGAFTGAGKSRQGIFAEAEGGTLFLDEISEMPAPLQAKLLRMLQDGRIRPEHLPPRIRETDNHARLRSSCLLQNGLRISGDSLPTLEEVERRYIRHVMTKVQGNKRSAASILAIGRRTLYRRLEEMNEA